MKTYYRKAVNRNRELTAQELIGQWLLHQPPTSKCTLPIFNFQGKNAEFWGDMHCFSKDTTFFFCPEMLSVRPDS